MTAISGPVSQYLSQVESNIKKYLEYFELRGIPEPLYEMGDGLNPLQLPLTFQEMDGNPFDIIKKEPKKEEQFVNAMNYSHLHPSYNVQYLVDNFAFGSIDAGTVVDIGGPHKQASIEIVRKYPKIKCIVQDLPDTIVGLEFRVPDSRKGSISGIEHDFLNPQPVQGANIYLFRWILHHWSDKYCIKILRCLIPALKNGAQIVINDIYIPPPRQLSIAANRNLRGL
ncbi:MAG: hypothetical protein LQ341_003544 [Variospora aurantia]|nr:MAG: hypothetical protein LQ341_003544 [Variospora aurantia]